MVASRQGWRGFAMAAKEDKGVGDFYDVLGLKKECSEAELRNAYKKLAKRWHPDKCSAWGNAKRKEEAKEKFQEIQRAYSVLSDSNKRFLYDVGVYDHNDENDENGMGDFLGEMAQMISQTKPSEKGQESFEELQRLLLEMFQDDLEAAFSRGGGSSSGFGWAPARSTNAHGHCFFSASCTSDWLPFDNGGGGSHKRPSGISSNSGDKAKLDELNPGAAEFCFGSSDTGQSSRGRGGSNSKRRKQKVSSKHNIPSDDTELAL